MSENREALPRQCERERLLGSRWRDEHGNEYQVYAVHWADDPEIALQYVPPNHKKSVLSEIETTYTLVAEGYERVGT
jgi:hypothetical protein